MKVMKSTNVRLYNEYLEKKNCIRQYNELVDKANEKI